jgi:RNA polymerase sigma factor (sigma-70 family)
MANGPLGLVLRQIRRLAGGEPGADLTDSHLLERFTTRGEESAFAALVQRHGPMVLGVCRRVLHQAEDAEDAFQATFLVLARKARSVRRRESVGGWLYQVAYRLAVRARAASARRRAHERKAAVMAQARPEAEAGWDDVQPVLDQELNRLPEKYRLPLVLCYLEGKTNRQAADELGWPEGSMARRLARGRELLRERLVERGVGLPVGPLAMLLAVKAPAVVPTALLNATAAGAAAFAAGPTTVPGMISTRAAAWAEGMLKSMWITKLRLVAVVLLAGVVAGGAIARRAAQPPARDAGQAGTPQLHARPTYLPAPPPAEQLRTDRYGDPLPPAALVRLGTLRFRHRGPVLGVAFSPDGKMLASAGGVGDAAVHLWEARTGREIRELAGDGPAVHGLAFSPDGNLLASAGATVRLWDVHTGKEVCHFKGHDSQVNAVAFSPDGKMLASAGSTPDHDGKSSGAIEVKPLPGTIYLWDVPGGRALRKLEKHEADVMCLAFSTDGKTLASGGKDRALWLWDPATGRPLRRCTGHASAVSCVAFSRDSRRLASGGSWGDPAVRLWDPAAGRELRRFKGHSTMVSSLAFSPDGKTVASGGDDTVIRLWNAITGKALLSTGPAHRFEVSTLAFAPDGRTLASAGSQDHTLRLWDVATGKEKHPFAGHQHQVFSVAFSPDDKTVATAGWDASIRFWNAATGKQLRRLMEDQPAFPSVVFSPDGKTLAAGGWDHRVHVWDAATGKELRLLEGHRAPIWCVAFSPDGKLLASGSRDSTVRLWQVATGKAVLRLGGHAGAAQGAADVFSVAFSPDGTVLASGNAGTLGKEDTLHLWDVNTGREIRQLRGHAGRVDAVAFSPDGSTLASWGSWYRTIRLWDVATGEEVLQFRGQDACPSGERADGRYLAFSPDGRTLAVGSATDESLELWEVATGKQRGRLRGHRGAIGPVAFSPDGKSIASGSADTTVLLWDLRRPDGDGRPLRRKLTSKDMAAPWADLASDDAPRAYQAVLTMVGAPGQAVPFLQAHLSPLQSHAKRLAGLIADLDSRRFAVREKASQELEQLGRAAEPALRQALAGQPSAEVRRRIQRLLELQQARVPASVRLLRARALEVLEDIGNPEAVHLLEQLAQGAPEASLTEEAKLALRRLARRTPPKS